MMSKRRIIPGERHHWWPSSLSNCWTDNDGLVSWIHSSGKSDRSSPTKIARISDGHNLRIGSSWWDETFEHEFDRPDDNFPYIVQFLEGLAENHSSGDITDQPGFYAQPCEESDLHMLFECLVSLAVRSPKIRNEIASFGEFVWSNAQKSDIKVLTAANMRYMYSDIIENLAARGKFLVIFTKSKEFIFGDGFYNNLSISTQYLHNTEIIVPVTPKISVLYSLPMEYMVEPQIVTLKADDRLVELLNETLQIYAKDWLFYKSEEPQVSKDFLCAEHLIYSEGDPIKALIERIPGIPSRRGS